MEDNKIKYLSTRFKVLLGAGSFVIVGTVAGFLAGCTNNKSNNNTPNDSSNVASATDADAVTTEESGKEVITTTENTDENQEYYETIEEMEDNIIDFAEVYLPNGFGEIEIDETNKQAISEMYTNAYIMLNVKNMGKSLAVLDQELDIIPSEAAEDFMKFARLTAHYSQIQTPDTMLDFSKLVTNEEDAEFLNKLSEEIAYMNVATTAEERQERINNIIAIKESLNEIYELRTYDYSTMYMAINMIIEADATAKAYGLEIFTSEEDKNQVYNTFLRYNCGELNQEDLTATAISMEDVQSKNSFESRVSVNYKQFLEDMLIKVENMGLGDFDSYYSYEAVTGRIADKLIGLYVAPELTNIELENSIREQGPANGKDGIGTTSSVDVDPSDVPEEYKVPDTTEYDNSDNGKDINDVDIDDNTIIIPADQVDVVDAETAGIRGEAAGRGVGSAAAYNAQITTGTIPSEISSAPTPEVPIQYKQFGSSYISGWQRGYIAAYNNYVQTAKAAQSTPTTTYEPVDNGEEQVIEENISNIDNTNTPQTNNSNTDTSTPAQNNYNENGTYFEPANDGEGIIIEEEVITISELKDLRKKIIGAYATAYVDNYYNNLENNNAKRM